MDVGTLLVGVALLLVVVGFVARPFRAAARELDPGKAIEFWVARARDAEEAGGPRAEGPVSPDSGESVNYCRECGRRVAADDRFCSGCGTRLRGGAG
ncbi:MAG: zinc-ribbon domain-containing protein [Anaerolineae bacterium]|jgi:hypothetical protein